MQALKRQHGLQIFQKAISDSSKIQIFSGYLAKDTVWSVFYVPMFNILPEDSVPYLVEYKKVVVQKSVCKYITV